MAGTTQFESRVDRAGGFMVLFANLVAQTTPQLIADKPFQQYEKDNQNIINYNCFHFNFKLQSTN